MPVGTIVQRIPKGAPVTPQEMDDNLGNLRDHANAQELRMDVLHDTDGTLLPGIITDEQLTLTALNKWFAIDTGTSSNIVVAFAPAPAALADLDSIPLRIQVAAPNAGATQITVALQVGTGSANLRKGGLSVLQAGDLEANHIILVQYSTATGFFHLIGSVAQAADADATVTGASRFLTVRRTGASTVTVTVVGPDSLGAIGEVVLRDDVSQRAYRAVNVGVTMNPGAGAPALNGFDVATIPTTRWYYIWLIYDGTTVSGLFSISGTNPTMPTGYTYKALVGAVHNVGGTFAFDDINEYSDTKRYISHEYATAAGEIPAGGLSHNLGGTPRLVNWVLVKVASAGTTAGWAIGDEIQAAGLYTGSSNTALWSTASNGTHVFCSQGGAIIDVRHKTSGAATAILPSDWRAKCYAEL